MDEQGTWQYDFGGLLETVVLLWFQAGLHFWAQAILLPHFSLLSSYDSVHHAQHNCLTSSSASVTT
jgi:hypothetical protein